MAYTKILTTKLYKPPMKPGLVRRPGLVQRIEHGYQTGKCVTLVSAPAGFGKTTLINEWISATRPARPFGWVSLDEGDNDPLRFLTYLVSAFQKVKEELGQSVLSLLQSSQTSNLTDLVEALINEISAMSDPFLIVLDDYHLIKNIEIHSLMKLFMQRQPGILHLVMITREDPPLALPRLRVLGQVTEIRERDLRFSLAEAQTFLVETMRIDLTPEDVGKLEERTEGWAAGIQLAALALEECADEVERDSFIQAFAGSNRMIVDYLISEVLLRQPDATQAFLLGTSILERFCAELCDTVVFGDSEINRSQAILEFLENGNMFLVPLDNQRHWYRYHHLFSEMLSHSLRRSSAQQIPALHRRASEWFETHGLFPEAVKHAAAYAAASADWEFARSMLDRLAMAELFQGQSSLVIEWCRVFPKAFLENAPEVCIYYAWALALTFRNDYLEAVEEKLQLAARAIESASLPSRAPVGEDGALVPLKEWVAGQICVIRSQVLLGGFQTFVDPQEEISLSLKGLELLPEGENVTRAICRINLAHAQTMQNNPVEAQNAFEEALPFMLASHNYLTGVTAIFYQARLAYYLGQLDRAEALCRQWKTKFAEMAEASARDGRELPATRGLDIVLSLILMERDQLEEAERLLVQALDLLGWASWMELHGFIVLARLRFMRGNFGGAQEILQRMARQGPQHAACAGALQVLLDLKKNWEAPAARSKAEIWINTHAPNLNPPLALGMGPYHCDAEYFYNLAWSQVQVELGHSQEAAAFVGPALKSAQEHGLKFRAVELSLAQAIIDEKQGNHASALAVLGNALEIAERHGYIRVFEDSPELSRLLKMAVDQNIHPQYAKQVLAAFNRLRSGEKTAATAAVEMGKMSLVEPLSAREIEVLALMAEGLSNAAIAARLYVSTNTLKAHTQNIFGKLDVHSRVQALNKARELEII